MKTPKFTFNNGMGISSDNEFRKSGATLPHPGSNRVMYFLKVFEQK